jgi:hypothetical protein
VDLSFWDVNDDTVRLAPLASMQFGQALEQLLFQLCHANPAFGPVYMCKIDISDGFYQIGLNFKDAPALGILLPVVAGEPPLVAIPHAGNSHHLPFVLLLKQQLSFTISACFDTIHRLTNLSALLKIGTPAVSRAMKGSITTRDPAAYLLCLSSLHQCHHCYLADFSHISGPANAMADDGSHLFHLTDKAFLSHFEQHYLQPLPWKLCHLRPKMTSALILALHCKQSNLQLFLNVPMHKTIPGISGKTFAWSMVSTHSSTKPLTQSISCLSLQSGTVMDVLQKRVTPSNLRQRKMPFVLSARQ